MTYTVDKLKVECFENRDEMGKKAASDVISRINVLKDEKDIIRIVFAAAPSQNDILKYLRQSKEIPWSRIHAFHMDEYIGLPSDHPQNFRSYLNKTLFDKVPIGKKFLIQGEEEDSEAECDRYTKLLEANQPDIVIMGIGENGHIAFNDPPVANFVDKKLVKVVELDQKSRHQQVNDGCFSCIEEVPTHAITLTIPALMRSSNRYCVVPGKTKENAVYHTLTDEVSTKCPATVMRNTPGSIIYIDTDSARLWLQQKT